MRKKPSYEALEQRVQELEQVEEELRKNEQRYRFLINATTSIYWTTDAAGAFIAPQPSWEKYTGQPWSDHKGFGWTKMIHAEDVDRIRKVWRKSCQTLSVYETWGRVWSAQFQRYRYFEVRAAPVLNSDGAVSEWTGYIIDTTRRKEAEIDLREASERLHQAQQMAGLGLWDWEISSNALAWSDKVYAIFGRDRHSFHPTVESFEACIHPEDYQRFIVERKNALAGKKTVEIEYRIRWPDGSERYIHEIAKMIRNRNGEVVWVSGTVQDISKRKWEEENLRIYENIISSTPDGIAFLDKTYRYIIVNKSYEKFSGVKKDRFVGKTVAEYLGEDIFEQFVKPNFDKCLGGETIRLQNWFEYPMLGKRYVEVTYFPYRDTGHRIIGIVANTRDITEQKRSEEALQISYRESELKATISKLFLMSPKSRLFNGIADLLISAFESRYGYFGYMDEKGDLVSPTTSHEFRESALTPDKIFVESDDTWGDVLAASVENRQLMVRNKTPNSPDEKATLHNALTVPLVAEKKLIGLMAVANKPSDYNEEDIKLMASLSEFIAPIVRIFLDKEHAQDQLESNAKKLRERNTALNVLIDNREDEKKKLSDMILENFEQLVYPYFEMIKKCKDRDDMFTLLNIIEVNANKSLSLLQKSYSLEYRKFTPTEILVADMIKAGKMSKDIAAILNISPRTVFFHRENIRKKLKLYNKKSNLRTALLSL